MAQLKDN